MIAQLYRRTLLGLAGSRSVRTVAERLGPRIGVGRFVAGSTLQEALPAVRNLQASGRHVILDLLGEYVDNAEDAAATAATIGHAIDLLGTEISPATISVKPTQLGLAIDSDLAFDYASDLLARAERAGTALCLDMENAVYVERTLELFERLRGAGHGNVATVLQSYLFRTPDDLERLLALAPELELRIVKGAYREQPEVAHQRKSHVDDAFRDLVYRGLEAGARIAIATHDERLITEIIAFVRGAGLGLDHYEFQLLYGVRPQLQADLAKQHPVRIYVPFGQDWYGYFSRRLAERPANLAFVLRGLVG